MCCKTDKWGPIKLSGHQINTRLKHICNFCSHTCKEKIKCGDSLSVSCDIETITFWHGRQVWALTRPLILPEPSDQCWACRLQGHTLLQTTGFLLSQRNLCWWGNQPRSHTTTTTTTVLSLRTQEFVYHRARSQAGPGPARCSAAGGRGGNFCCPVGRGCTTGLKLLRRTARRIAPIGSGWELRPCPSPLAQ